MASRGLGALLMLALPLALGGPAAAHGGSHAAAPPRAVAAAGTEVKLRGCLLTAAFVPRPASALQMVFRRPLDLSQTFYGTDPLLGVWGLSCRRARVAGRRAGRVVASMVAVPTELTSPGALPLANNFGHALIGIDTSSRALAVALRRAKLPGRHLRGIRYRHSPAGAIPFRGRLTVPRRYEIAVSATDPDPTNPHDHANRFEHWTAARGTRTISLSADDAVDRFCISPSTTCSASVRARRGTAFARLLGGRSADARAGFDHQRLARIDLTLGRPGR